MAIGSAGRGKDRIVQIGGIFGLACLVACFIGWNALVIPYAIGIGVLLVVWCMPWRAGRMAAKLGSLAYGVYILHPLLAAVIARLCGVHEGTMLVVYTTVASMATTTVLQRTPLRFAL